MGRAAKLALVGAAGLVLGVSLYVGLVQAGALASPFAPAIVGDLEAARSGRPGLRVLFVGNSQTARNEMPEMVSRFAASDPGASAVFAVGYAANGWSLREASEDDGLAALLEELDWDVVVLQEQSRLPAFGPERLRDETVPYASLLQSSAGRAGAETVLFMTWAWKDGEPEVPGDTFSAMQARVAAGYTHLGADLGARVAPVGVAWAEALARDADLELWSWDGSHPSPSGSYLAAAVFYAFLTGRDPVAGSFTAGLDGDEARFLREVASDVVG